MYTEVSKNAPISASCDFNKNRLILIFLADSISTLSTMMIQLSLLLHFTYLICF